MKILFTIMLALALSLTAFCQKKRPNFFGLKEVDVISQITDLRGFHFMSRNQTPRGVNLIYNVENKADVVILLAIGFDVNDSCNMMCDLLPTGYFSQAVKNADSNPKYVRIKGESLAWINKDDSMLIRIQTTELYCEIRYTAI